MAVYVQVFTSTTSRHHAKGERVHGIAEMGFLFYIVWNFDESQPPH